MSILPIVDANYFKGRNGILKVALELNNCGLIFRETPNADVGIDGQVEYVNTRKEAIGKTIAVQIKSGDSYLEDKGEYWAFYAKEKHKNYWELYPIPVILLIYSPLNDKIYFIDARYQLNIPNNKRKFISIPKNNVFGDKTKAQLFESLGDFGTPFLSIEKVLDEMLKNECDNPTFKISYFDLFIVGLTNICRQIFFSMENACEIAEYNNDTEFGLSVGPYEHEFLHNYVKFIVSQNIAKIDYADYLIDWKEREIQSMFIATLTQRGHQLLEHISKKEVGINNSNLLREGLIRMDFQLNNKLQKLKQFKDTYGKTL